MAVNTTDLVGYNNGKLIVNSFSRQALSGGRTRALWNVTCLICGKESEQTRDSIVSGNGPKCGCYRREFGRQIGKSNHIDLTGQKIGEWFVEKRADDYIHNSGVHAVRYQCLCTCGERRIVLASSLMNGESLSCGHGRQDLIASILFKDLTNQQIYEWHVDYRVPNSVPIRFHCTCSCGVEKDVLSASLVNGNCRSCGHLRASHGEQDIKYILEENNIKHKFDCCYKGLTEYCGRHLRVDFQLMDPNNNIVCVIEFQGIQHYKEIEKYHNGIFGKNQREETDKIKRDYFKIINMPFYEIRYDENIAEKLNAILVTHHLLHDNTVPSLQETA